MTTSTGAHDERDGATRGGPASFETVWLGARAGFVATLVMTAFRLPISRSLPPTDEFWNRYVRADGDGSATVPALVLHLLYGTVAGVVYVSLVHVPEPASDVAGERLGVVTGVGYGLVLSAFGLRYLLERLLDQDLSPDERFVFHLGHVVYGLTLGTWLGSRSTD